MASVGPRTSDRISEPSARYEVAYRRAMSALVHPHESVCTPVLAADAVMEKEQTLGIVFLLDRAQPRVIAAPERVLPVRLEVVGLPDTRGGARLVRANRLRKAAALLGRKFRTTLIVTAQRSVLTLACAGRGDLLHRVAEGEARRFSRAAETPCSSPAISR
jgi:hypothetical protein